MNRILRLLIPTVLLLSLIAACVNPVTGEYMSPLFVSPTPTPTVDPSQPVVAESTPVPPAQETVGVPDVTEEVVESPPMVVEPAPTEAVAAAAAAEVAIEATAEPETEPVAEPEAVAEPVPAPTLSPDNPLADFVLDEDRFTIESLGVEVERPGPAWLLLNTTEMGIDLGGMQPLAMLFDPAPNGELARYITFATTDVPDFSVRALYRILQADPVAGLEMLAAEMGDMGENTQITQVGPYKAVLVSAPNPLGDTNYLWIVVRPSAAIYILAEGFADGEEATAILDAHTRFLPLEAEAALAPDLLPDPADPAISPAEQRGRLVAIAEQVRNLESQSAVDFNFMDEAALRAVLEGTDLPTDEEMRRSYGEERMLKLLGLIPAEMDLTKLVLDLYQSEIAGYYDDETKEFVLIDEPNGDANGDKNGETSADSPAAGATPENADPLADSPGTPLDLMAQVTFVHEYVHALQDQTFDLTRFTGSGQAEGDTPVPTEPDRTDDATLAIRALVEGDAQFATSLYIVDYVDLVALYNLSKEQAPAQDDAQVEAPQPDAAPETPLDVETEVGMEGELDTALLDDAPNFVRESMIFPYISGELFVLAIYDELGWAGVNDLWTNPPVSTEQILHPALYPADTPTPVDLPADLADQLSAATGTEWSEFVRNVWGEFQLRTMMAEHLSDLAASKGADGWDGDQFAFFSDDAQELVVISTVWDSASEARGGRTALSDWLDASGFSAGEPRRYDHPGDPENGVLPRQVFLTSEGDAVHFLLATDAASLEAAVSVLEWE